jgi:hypothetical protein
MELIGSAEDFSKYFIPLADHRVASEGAAGSS